MKPGSSRVDNRALIAWICAAWMFLLPSVVEGNYVPLGDDCSNAVWVNSLPFSASGDTSNATADFVFPSNRVTNTSCGTISTTARGVWYRIQLPNENQINAPFGNRGSFVRAILRDTAASVEAASNLNDTKFQFALFRGNSCDSLECRMPSQYLLQKTRTEPTLTWHMASNEVYYLLVTGTDEGQVGPFSLDIQRVDRGRPPPNDQCQNAKEPVLGTTVNLEIEIGDTSGARPHGIRNDACGIRPETRGLFYQVVGTGVPVQVTLQIHHGSLVKASEQRLELAIFEGSCTDQSSCVVVSDFLTQGDRQSISFVPMKGVKYYLAVTGERFEDDGRFDLALSTTPAYINAYSSTTRRLNIFQGLVLSLVPAIFAL